MGCVLSSCGSAVLVLVLVRLCHRHTKSRKRDSMFVSVKYIIIIIHHIFSGVAVEMRNVAVYDEVDLPPTTSSSSVIPTETNTDYVTTTMSQTPPISTQHNMAYGNVCVSQK